MVGLGAFYELEVACRGTPDARSGYVLNIADVDRAARELALPLIEQGFRRRTASSEPVLAAVVAALAGALPALASVRWWLTPYHFLAMDAPPAERVLISQQFEFAAAHRLHSPQLSDRENLAVFGKCNNPSGHGHNYRLEVAVSVPLNRGPGGLDLPGLERIVLESVIARYDHKHLNLDTPDFEGATPSVEHISRRCHQLLDGPVASAGGRLERVTVWETDKTACTYPAP